MDWGYMIAGGAVGATAAIVAAPALVTAAGFTSTGIAAKSAAAWGMSCYAGATPAAGIIATGQSIGALGTVLASPVATVIAGTVGSAAGVAGAAVAPSLGGAARVVGSVGGSAARGIGNVAYSGAAMGAGLASAAYGSIWGAH